jgi:hypothetical protein
MDISSLGCTSDMTASKVALTRATFPITSTLVPRVISSFTSPSAVSFQYPRRTHIGFCALLLPRVSSCEARPITPFAAPPASVASEYRTRYTDH